MALSGNTRELSLADLIIVKAQITADEEPTEAREDLALARARRVAEFLEEQNLDASRLRVDSRGTSEPFASSSVLAGRRRNRRAEVWVLPH